MKNEISTEQLIEAAKDCSQRAIERAEVLGIAYSIRRGDYIVRINPDGTEKILKKMQPSIKYKGERIIQLHED